MQRDSIMLTPITSGDVPRIVALMNRAFKADDASTALNQENRHFPGDITSDERFRAETFEKPDVLFLKWEGLQGRLQGCVSLRPLDGQVWNIGWLVVDPEQHGNGLGKGLLSAAERLAHERGGKRVRLTALNIRKALVAWYVRRGFHATGETHPFPYGDGRFDEKLPDDLSFVVLEKDLPE